MAGSVAPSHVRTLLVAATVIGAASLITADWVLGTGHSHAAQSRVIENQSTSTELPPRTIELTSEKAARVRAAIKRDDFSTARRIAGDVATKSILTNWRYHPFDIFIAGIADVADPTFAAHLNAWVSRDEKDDIPRLIRAQYYYDIAWTKRGSRFVNEVEADAMAAFGTAMKEALADVDAATRLDEQNPYGFYLKLRILHGFGPSQGMTDALDQAIAKYPHYYPFYKIALDTLEPKWGGTVAQMYAFVDKHAGHTAADSPLKVLYLDLYAELVNAASVDCKAYQKDRDQWAQCVSSATQKTVTPALEKQVVAALQLYDHADKYEFGLAVQDIISYMLRTGGADVYSGAVLQLAATAMHSDTQLVRRDPGRNDYVIDRLVAQSWYGKGFYDNALSKYRDALKSIDATTFPSEEEKDLAVAAVHEDIARAHSHLHQYPDMIASEKIAVATGNLTQMEHLICAGLYRLKKNADAARACGKAIADQPGNVYAYYWRGMALRDLGRPDDALRDLAFVAGSEDDFRASAAIDMSMIYFNRNDIRGALNVLNRYPYLYDPATTSHSSVAVAYNNRCYAYMELGELKQALDDCTQSLRYGSLPDAYRKQQELVKRLRGT
jgi:tetratricopeptide (TPR) repeat protein